jgi:formylglycine-generating enzyme required for sulfatase activity
VCNAAGTDTRCTAAFNGAAATTEACNGLDDDCDGVVDEAFNSPAGAANGNYVKPAVVQVGSVWMYAYEASRPTSSLATSGSGNGYHTSAPANTTLDKTISCSVRDRVPWFNVTADEATQTCTERGGRLCTLAEWQNACRAQSTCTWGYATGCTAPANYGGGPFCNLHGFDFVSGGSLDDGLLPTRSSRLNNCSSRYNTSNIYDITGNLREIVRNGSAFTLMGGAFNTVAEAGATCDFSFYSVSNNFRLYDTGFRCCFTQNPSP